MKIVTVGAVVVVAFGAACLFAGMGLMNYTSRLENLERGRTYERQAPDRTVVFPDDKSGQQPNTQSSSTTSNTSQPQIYFMVGGQGGGYPAQPAPVQYYAQPNPYGMPNDPNMNMYFQPSPQIPVPAPAPAYQFHSAPYQNMPSAMPNPYQIQNEMNQFLIQKYQNEFSDYMQKRAMIAGPGPNQLPRNSWMADPSGLSAMQGYQPPYISSDILVPASLTLSLKRRFSRDENIESWLREETSLTRDEYTDDDADVAPAPGGAEPDLDEILRRLAESTFQDGQYERASRIYAELASRQIPMTVPELLRWAKAAELSGNADSALEILELVLKNDPGNVEVLKEAAGLMVANQQFGVASEYYLKLMEAEPFVREWRMMRAKTLTWSGRGKEAVELMRQLYLEDSSDWDLSQMLAELLLSEHLFEEALPILDTLIAHSPADDSLKVMKMNSLMALQRFREAADMCALLLERRPNDPDLLLKMAVNLVAAQDFKASIAPFDKYLALKPDDIEVRAQFAEALMAAAEYGRAADEYGVLLGEDPDNVEILGKQANAYMAAQDFENAAEVYADLIQFKPDDPDVNHGYVVSLRMSERPAEALMAAQQYLQYDPADVKMLVQAGEISAELKNYEQSVRFLRSAARFDPGNEEVRLGLANALLWDMQYEAAETEYRRFLRLNQENTSARRGLARSLYFQRKYDEAFKMYRSLAAEYLDDAIEAEYKYYRAVSVGMNDEAQKQLLVLQYAEPDDITWKSDRVQVLLREHRFKEAREQAGILLEEDPGHQPTLKGIRNMNMYLTSWPVMLRGGMLRKSSKQSDNEEQDRQANISYSYFGLHGEKSLSPDLRFTADLDKERFKMRTDGVPNLSATRFKLGAIFEGHPTLRAQGELGYRWFGEKRSVALEDGGRDKVDDQWLYDVRGEMHEVAGTALTIGAFSRRREHYDNWRNAYDNLYAYDFGVDAHYRWNKWDFLGVVQSAVLSDSNSNIDLHAAAKYRLVETPKALIMVGGNIEYLDWKWNRPTYYSPQDFYKYGLDLDIRYYICRDPEVWGGCETYVDTGLSVYRDRFSSVGQKVWLGFNHDYNRRLSLFARVDYNKESYYNELKLFGGFNYKFGGCK